MNSPNGAGPPDSLQGPQDALDETAWLIEETWSGFVHYVHRDFNAAAWRAEAGRVREFSRRKQRFITKSIEEAMRFPTRPAAEQWRMEQPIWFSRGDQFQVREHMWPAPGEAAGPEGLSVPQDAKSNPSNGLVERVARIVDADCFNGMRDFGGWPLRRDWALSKAREIHALYQQEGVLSSPRGETACFECAADLHGPYCPACNPEMAHAGELLEALRAIAAYRPDPSAGDPYTQIAVFSRQTAFTAIAAPSPPIAPSSQRGENRSANAISGPTLHGADTEAVGPGPIAWRVRDFADGWIYYGGDEAHARHVAAEMGDALVEPIYVSPPLYPAIVEVAPRAPLEPKS